MTNYNPDYWSIIKIDGPDPHYRVFGSWSGGYTYGGHWRMNSGIVRVEEDANFFLFHGSSGSIYKCHKGSYGCHHESIGQLNYYTQKTDGYSGALLPWDTNWMEMDWLINE